MSSQPRIQNTFTSRIGIAALGLTLALALPGCRREPAAQSANAPDPADANFASASEAAAPSGSANSSPQATRVLAQRSATEPQQQGEDYSQQAANGAAQQPGYGYPSGPNPAQEANSQSYGAPSADPEADAYAADLTAETATEPPPPLPQYEQPPCPDPDYLWTPGYWAWGPSGYYWVPGAWVAAPYAGALWTPGYWALVDGAYRFHHGFWGPHIGFYGGIDYGYGYTGYGYYGGYWRDNHFFYNTAVNRVNVNAIRNVYVRNVAGNNANRVSYNGGRGGIDVRPRPAELAALHEQRIPPMQSQLAVRREAEGNRAQLFRENNGRPQITAAARPVAADRTLPSALPRAAAGAMMSGTAGGNRPAQGAAGTPGARGLATSAAPAARGSQSSQPNPQNNRESASTHPASPRAVEPQRVVPPVHPAQIQQLPNRQTARAGSTPSRPAPANVRGPENNPTQRPAQPAARMTPETQNRSVQPGRAANPQEAQPNIQRGAQPQVRPQSQPQVQQHTQPQAQRPTEARPQNNARPAPAAPNHPAPQQRSEPRRDEHDPR